MDENRLSGEIPWELGDLSSLAELSLASNRLTGEIPDDLGFLIGLELLDLYGNPGLTGCVPEPLSFQLDDDSYLGGLSFCGPAASVAAVPYLTEVPPVATEEVYAVADSTSQPAAEVESTSPPAVAVTSAPALPRPTATPVPTTTPVPAATMAPQATESPPRPLPTATPALAAEPPRLTDISFGFEHFQVIWSSINEYGDHDAECKSRLGNHYRLTDWTDLTSWVSGGGSVTALIAGLKLTKEGDPASIYPHDGSDINGGLPKVSLSGNERWNNGRRHFFISRHDHVLPRYFLAHDDIDNYHISLGSWYGEGGSILCYNTATAPGST